MIRGASVIGREHVRLGKNNQDAWAGCTVGETNVIVVADGCSSEKSSEVGAQLGARWLASYVAHSAASSSELAQTATRAFAAWLYRLAVAIEGDFARVVQDQLLFTFLCAVQRADESIVFGIGDGAVLVDDALTVLDSGGDNAPEYLAYALLGRELAARVHFEGTGVSRIAVMTDGLSAVVGTSGDALLSGLGSNSHALQRRLNVFSETQRLGDDATIVVLTSASEGSKATYEPGELSPPLEVKS